MLRSYWKGPKYFCAMYKIYYGNKSLIILSLPVENNLTDKDAPKFAFSENGLNRAIEALKTTETQCSFIVTEDKEEALNALKKHYEVIQAGGGLVQSPDGNLLLIFRRDKWDLPKGKLDEGETMEKMMIFCRRLFPMVACP